MLFLHQDSWAWDDQSLVLGFMPIGLAYHAVFFHLLRNTWRPRN